MSILHFPGGDAPLPEPTSADLVLSARQWCTAVSEYLEDAYKTDKGELYLEANELGHLLSMCDRLAAVLLELEKMCAK